MKIHKRNYPLVYLEQCEYRRKKEKASKFY